MAFPKGIKKAPAKKASAKKAKPQTDVTALARHYSKTCCSIDFEALILIEERYASFVLAE
jgi:hypothetical protein